MDVNRKVMFSAIRFGFFSNKQCQKHETLFPPSHFVVCDRRGQDLVPSAEQNLAH